MLSTIFLRIFFWSRHLVLGKIGKFGYCGCESAGAAGALSGALRARHVNNTRPILAGVGSLKQAFNKLNNNRQQSLTFPIYLILICNLVIFFTIFHFLGDFLVIRSCPIVLIIRSSKNLDKSTSDSDQRYFKCVLGDFKKGH